MSSREKINKDTSQLNETHNWQLETGIGLWLQGLGTEARLLQAQGSFTSDENVHNWLRCWLLRAGNITKNCCTNTTNKSAGRYLNKSCHQRIIRYLK